MIVFNIIDNLLEVKIVGKGVLKFLFSVESFNFKKVEFLVRNVVKRYKLKFIGEFEECSILS